MINKIYNCNNLELLKQLPDNYIDLIYCDILYGTGRNFGDYQDLKSDRKIIEEHYIPRIKQMYRVLKNTGSIYLQMDYRINHWIRCLMDDIFGYNNFRNEIIWCYTFPSNVKNKFPNKHDNILFYSKTNNYIFNVQYIPHKSGIHNKGIYKNKNKTSVQDIKNLEKRGKIVEDYWVDCTTVNNLHKENTKYPTQKPKSLLKRIIKASSNENDLVADFYCGSGTSCIVAKELNRNYIGCDISKNACEITEKRIKN